MRWAHFWFSFDGRIGRLAFVLGILSAIVLWVIAPLFAVALLGALFPALGESGVAGGVGLVIAYVVTGVMLGGVFWSQYALAAKRWHDLGHSGWFSLFTFIPLVGFVAALILWFAPGEAQENDFGPPPRLALRRTDPTGGWEPDQAGPLRRGVGDK